MDFTEQDKAEEWFNNSEHGKGRIAGFVPMLLAEYAEYYHQSKVKDMGIFGVIDMCCPYCHSDDIVWYGLSGDCVCNKCGKDGSIIL